MPKGVTMGIDGTFSQEEKKGGFGEISSVGGFERGNGEI